jgi:hypothetical protein
LLFDASRFSNIFKNQKIFVLQAITFVSRYECMK